MKENIILEKSFIFSLKILQFYKELMKHKEFIISRQLLRCATSIGANIEEAGAAISRRDFALKMSIASKEAREARYWLKLLKEDNFRNVSIEELLGFTPETETIVDGMGEKIVIGFHVCAVTILGKDINGSIPRKRETLKLSG